MTVRDVWQTNPVFRLVMTLIAGVGVSAIVGGIVLYAEVKTTSAIVKEIQSDFGEFRAETGERLRYLERNRRGLVPGEP